MPRFDGSRVTCLTCGNHRFEVVDQLMPGTKRHETGNFGMTTIKVKDVATLLAVGTWLFVTVSACEYAKRAESVSAEDVRAQARQSTATEGDRSRDRPGAMAEKEIARAEEPVPEVSRLEPFDFFPEMPPQPGKGTDTVAAGTKHAKESGLTDVFFDFDKFAIRAGSVPVLEKNAELLKHMDKNSGVLIEGHGDEHGTVGYNLELGKRRALAVKEYLVDLGVEESRMDIVSYGKEKPFCTESTPHCWQQNRRVHFVW